MSGIIIGAGIGGLTTAIALKSYGINIDIYEAAEELKPIGAGILVPPNAMRVLAQLGLTEQVTANGNELNSLQILDYRGKHISTTPSFHEFDNLSLRTVAIHRGKLHTILRDCLDDKAIHLGCELDTIVDSEESLQVHFTNGLRLTAEFILGADGLRSKTRQAIMPKSILRDSHQVCWRGVANIRLPEEWVSQLTELWGNGARFGFVQISDSQVYWYATVVDKLYNPTKSNHVIEYLQNVFSSYAANVRQIIDSTPYESIIEGHIYDLKPLKKWGYKNTVLLGDAAHAITPNLGQGGALAIEDAFQIAKKIAVCSDPVNAFVKFQKARLHRVNKISRASWIIGQVTNWQSPLACSFRNNIIRTIALAMGKNQSRFLYNFEVIS